MPKAPRAKTVVACRLRVNATIAETKLWRGLREASFAHRFRRQHPIGRFVVDFACPPIGLIVEVDGGQHAEAVEADAARTAALAAYGYRVIRFWNNDVLSNLQGVLEVIRLEVERSLRPTSPYPLRPPGRRGKSGMGRREG